ncbi:MAG: rhodanese-like domain-containing protein [Pseudomonadales bacterium]|nr:rhodanese-like domain-containing protein [Pseudomonadales bacterium]
MNFKQLLFIAFTVLVPLTAFASPDFWIDVRSDQEYAESHLPGAIHIPFDTVMEKVSVLTSDKNAEIYLYCRSGHRAGIALKSMQAMGYTNVKNIGGLTAALKLEASIKKALQ